MTTVEKLGGPYGPTERDGQHEVRYRLHLTDGTTREPRRTFGGKLRADRFVKKLRWAADGTIDRATGRRWGWSAGLEPVLLDGATVAAPTAPDTVWMLCTDWRAATWHGRAPNGRKADATALRATVSHLVRQPGKPPPAAAAYLATVAFRGPVEPTRDELTAAMPDGVRHGRRSYSAADLWTGRQWIEDASLPLDDLDRDRFRSLIRHFGAGRSAATEDRYRSTIRSVIAWGGAEIRPDKSPRVMPHLLGGIESRGRPVSTLVNVPAVPDVDEMWRMAWACGVAVGPRSRWRWCALPLVMGGAGLRVGECGALLRRHIREETTYGGMWIDVRGTLSTPGRAWTDSGERTVVRGTKGRGEGNRAGRTTFLPPREASILREHLARFVGRSPNAPVFTGGLGGRIDIPNLRSDVWQPALELAFPPGHRLHDLDPTRHAFRHLTVTRWVRSGVPPSLAAEWGGWKNVSTMMDFYDSVMPADVDFALARMSR